MALLNCTGLFDSLQTNTFEVLLAQLLGFDYNNKFLSGYSSNAISSVGCAIPASLAASPYNLTGSSTMAQVQAAANSIVLGWKTSTTQSLASDMISLLDCLNQDWGNMTVTKTGNGTIVAGATATFTITARNAGEGPENGAGLTDNLPTAPGTLTWTITGGTGAASCSISSSVLTCSFGTLAAGASRTVIVSAATTAANIGTITNTAHVFAINEAAADTGNNNATAVIHVTP